MVRAVLAPVLLLASAAVAAAEPVAEPLPVIVTYELQRQHEAGRAERLDPKGFWVRQIVARLEDKKPGALGLARSATAKVAFTVGRDGHLVSKALVAPSGVAAADREALAMLERAQPFPPMPAAMDDTTVAFTLPLRFR